jgi:hypothetical protein
MLTQDLESRVAFGIPPGQARMVDTSYTGCWADVDHDDHEDMQACEANHDSGSV